MAGGSSSIGMGRGALAASGWEVEKELRGILVFSPYPLTDLLGRVNINDMEGMENYKHWHRRDELISNGT